jgi:hypothetical protein
LDGGRLMGRWHRASLHRRVSAWAQREGRFPATGVSLRSASTAESRIAMRLANRKDADAFLHRGRSSSVLRQVCLLNTTRRETHREMRRPGGKRANRMASTELVPSTPVNQSRHFPCRCDPRDDEPGKEKDDVRETIRTVVGSSGCGRLALTAAFWTVGLPRSAASIGAAAQISLFIACLTQPKLHSTDDHMEGVAASAHATNNS